MRTIDIEDGIHYVDVQRIYFKGQAGVNAGECRGGASGVGLAASLRRAVALFSRMWRSDLVVDAGGIRWEVPGE